ncbi:MULTISPECIES: hypothetical protein [Ochrobactrum]|uniref:Uncharacterized protein n=1 Tax=Ochrobactrum quorumnocens TaxID=271865 RepID=A0A5N1JYF9_9HYPH|nr:MULTISPECIES: hypothetical protein [Brucella/Ochrobactrum group]KAA9368269.1 hypothetical protein F3W84_10280 [[Ochrobactrum] quorumnocens]MBD7991832.1 hypothetical protein [Ochrobactrum gallinarum]
MPAPIHPHIVAVVGTGAPCCNGGRLFLPMQARRSDEFKTFRLLGSERLFRPLSTCFIRRKTPQTRPAKPLPKGFAQNRYNGGLPVLMSTAPGIGGGGAQ